MSFRTVHTLCTDTLSKQCVRTIRTLPPVRPSRLPSCTSVPLTTHRHVIPPILSRAMGLYRHPKMDPKPTLPPPHRHRPMIPEDPPEDDPDADLDEFHHSYTLTNDIYYRKPTIEQQREIEKGEDARRRAVRQEIDNRVGRLFTDPYEIPDVEWGKLRTLEDLPDWKVEVCSRVSRDKVVLYDEGVPTLAKFATLPLPPSSPPHPAIGNPTPYIRHTKRTTQNLLYDAIAHIAQPKLEGILNIDDEQDQQDAIDALFEVIHTELVTKNKTNDGKVKTKGPTKLQVLSTQPDFPALVEMGLEEYLRNVNTHESEVWKEAPPQTLDTVPETVTTPITTTDKALTVKSTTDKPSIVKSTTNQPIFMDLLQAKDCTLDTHVPNLLQPLQLHAKEGVGRMLEEWSLASNQSTKRIMARHCMSHMAHLLATPQTSRIYVKGVKGVGKTTALAVMVASARLSGHIVLYLPDGDRLRQHGFYNEENSLESHMFDLPMLSQEVCGQLLAAHQTSMVDMTVETEIINKFLCPKKLQKLEKVLSSNDSKESLSTPLSLNTLLQIGSETASLAAGCYGIVLHQLMHQSSIPFTIIMDEFNCYFDHGHYYNELYHPQARKAIPLHRITLFQPLLKAMGVEKSEEGIIQSTTLQTSPNLNVIAGITESHAVAKKFTLALNDVMEENKVEIVHITPYSAVEVECIIANFEAIGIGNLRFDHGETIMNPQEVAYLGMVSGGIGQNLMDVCIS